VAEWYGAGFVTVTSPMAAVYQRQLSMPSLRGRLMNTSESWGVNGIPRNALAPYNPNHPSIHPSIHPFLLVSG